MAKVAAPIVLAIILLWTGVSNHDSEDTAGMLDFVPDIGCTVNRPALCPNGVCYEDYSFCAAVQGCVVAPDVLMCPSGVCTSDFGQCSDNRYECDLENYERCADGVCRRNCTEIFTNGCPSSAPFYCPSGRCGRTMLECTG